MNDDSGASAVEYGLLVAAIAGVIVVITYVLGSYTQGQFDGACDDIAARVDSSTCDAG